MSTLEMRINNLESAWFKFKTQHHRLHIIAGRGRLQGLQAYHATLQRCCLEVRARAEDALNEEAIKAAHEKANNAKAAEKAAKKEATRKAKAIPESKAAPQHRDAQGPKAVTKLQAIPESSSRVSKLSLQDESPGGTSKANPELMLQSALWILQMAFLLLQSGPQAQASQAIVGLLGMV